MRLGTLLARHWLEVGQIKASYLYVDGHTKVYNGTRLVPEVWDSHRRMPSVIAAVRKGGGRSALHGDL
jgi:hypothetical protein